MEDIFIKRARKSSANFLKTSRTHASVKLRGRSGKNWEVYKRTQSIHDLD